MVRFHVKGEERSLLNSRSFSLRPLAWAGYLHIWQVFLWALFPAIIFIFTLLVLTSPPLLQIARFSSDTVATWLYAGGLCALLAYPTVTFVVLTVGIITTRMTTGIKYPAVLFWMWWPSWKLLVCWATAAVATKMGNVLWHQQFRQYWAYYNLQAYRNVDPYTTTGTRIQDVGIATFNHTTSVDRVHGGCLMNDLTFCVAPIIRGGEVHDHQIQTTVGVSDLFVAGVDCCNCPLSDFRCGEWDTIPGTGGQFGGWRIMDQSRMPFYRLAAEQFATRYGKRIRHPIFFQWVNDPVTKWHDLWSRGIYLLWLALLTVPLLLLIVAFALNGAFKVLIDGRWAAPLETHIPSHEPGAALASRLQSLNTPKFQNQRKYTEEQAESYRLGGDWIQDEPAAVLL